MISLLPLHYMLFPPMLTAAALALLLFAGPRFKGLWLFHVIVSGVMILYAVLCGVWEFGDPLFRYVPVLLYLPAIVLSRRRLMKNIRRHNNPSRTAILLPAVLLAVFCVLLIMAFLSGSINRLHVYRSGQVVEMILHA